MMEAVLVPQVLNRHPQAPSPRRVKTPTFDGTQVASQNNGRVSSASSAAVPVNTDAVLIASLASSLSSHP